MRAYRIAVTVSAAVLMALPILVMAEDKDDAKATPIKLEQLPPAVRKTIEKEASGNKIVEIEKEIDDGKTVYEAEVLIDGKEWEIEVAEDGKLISKAQNDDDDDDDDDDD